MKVIWIPSLVDVFSGIIYHNPVPSPAGQTRHGRRTGISHRNQAGPFHPGFRGGECGRIPGHPAGFGFQDRLQPLEPPRPEAIGNGNPRRAGCNSTAPRHCNQKRGATTRDPKKGPNTGVPTTGPSGENLCPFVSRTGIGYRLRSGGLSIFAPKRECQIDSGL